MFKFNLMDKVKDKVTGYAGTIIARTEYLDGTNGYGIEPTVAAGQPFQEAKWFGESRLEPQ